MKIRKKKTPIRHEMSACLAKAQEEKPEEHGLLSGAKKNLESAIQCIDNYSLNRARALVEDAISKIGVAERYGQ